MKRSKKQVKQHAVQYLSALKVAKEEGDISTHCYRELKKEFTEGLESDGFTKSQIKTLKNKGKKKAKNVRKRRNRR